MYSPIGLEPWEIVVASGLFAFGMLGVASIIGFTAAWFFFAERSAVRHPKAVAAPGEVRPAEYAAASPSAA